MTVGTDWSMGPVVRSPVCEWVVNTLGLSRLSSVVGTNRDWSSVGFSFHWENLQLDFAYLTMERQPLDSATGSTLCPSERCGRASSSRNHQSTLALGRRCAKHTANTKNEDLVPDPENEFSIMSPERRGSISEPSGQRPPTL